MFKLENKLKFRMSIFGLIVLTMLMAVGCTSTNGNFTDEMKIPYAVNLGDNGANTNERSADHRNSPYFPQVDFYHATSESLTILPSFRTIQQTSWWSCGPATILMVLDYYGAVGTWNEQSLADLRTDHSEAHIGTCLDQMIEILEGVGGFELETTYDFIDDISAIDLGYIQRQLQQGYPVLIGWNDWGGHWQVAIGYDTMGTEDQGDDVLIVADPYDTTDHNQDGYGIYPAQRFIYNFTFYNFFPEDHLNDACMIVVRPISKTE